MQSKESLHMYYPPRHATDENVEARRARRASVRGRARFREVGCNPFEVELHDLSYSGFRMRTYSRPQLGAHIWVTLPGLQALEAVVRRSNGNEFGCEFVLPLHPAVAEHMQRLLR